MLFLDVARLFFSVIMLSKLNELQGWHESGISLSTREHKSLLSKIPPNYCIQKGLKTLRNQHLASFIHLLLLIYLFIFSYMMISWFFFFEGVFCKQENLRSITVNSWKTLCQNKQISSRLLVSFQQLNP